MIQTIKHSLKFVFVVSYKCFYCGMLPMQFNLLQKELIKEGKCLYMEVVYNKEIKYDHNYIKYITNWCNNACFVLP